MPQRKKRGTSQRRRQPINLRNTQTVQDYNGFVVIRLPEVISNRARSLDAVAREFKLDRLATLLKRYNLPSQRLITSLSVEQLLELEGRARRSGSAPLHSMTSYWRLDARKLRKPLKEVLGEFRTLPHDEVDFAYLEKSTREPAVNADDEFANMQGYLDPEPKGIDARSAWDKGADGAGMHFVDLERGWFLGHEDLPAPTLIRNCNFDFPHSRDHGTGVLGVVAGVDNGRGIVGIAPKVDSVRVVSYFRADSCKDGHKDEKCKPLIGTHNHVVDAICVANWANPRPHVLLLEVQDGKPELPVESDVAKLEAIQLAVRNGVIVIEAAGNSGTDLDNWLDDAGQRRMNRKLWTPADAEKFDSGAILVGAAKKDPVEVPAGVSGHERLPKSNFGSRVDCYAWGEGIVSAGGGDLRSEGTDRNVNQEDNKRYTQIFGGTSGASAIIAGAALLVQGLHLEKKNSLLSPAKMREILSKPATGTPQKVTVDSQGEPILENIGVMPDLRRIIQTLGL
jgi:subtilisin family serine protease